MPDIVETATDAGTFTTLLKAASAAGLVEILKSPGPYTVFAPTDEVFAKLPDGTLESLLQDIPKLKKVVTYHIVFGDVMAEDLQEIAEAETVEGSIVAVESSSDDGIKINSFNILKTDIIADNGVIHVIDGVLMPAMVAGS